MMIREGEVVLVIAEDDPGDRALLENALKESGVKNRMVFAKDGQEVINYLNDSLVYSDLYKSSCLVMLDLKMPRLDGLRTLRILKKDVRFKRIPVVILTGLAGEEDVSEAYGLGASSFFKKPTDYRGFLELVRLLKQYWLQKAVMPA